MKILLAFFALVFSSLAVADTAPDPNSLMERYRGRIQQTLSEIKNFGPSCTTCGLFSAGEGGQGEMSPSCRATYKSIYKVSDFEKSETAADRVLNIKVAFGYMDYEGYTEDRYVSAAFVDELTAPCQQGRFACGFKQDPDDANLMIKQMNIMGPDGKNRRRTVRLQVHDSSATDSEKINRTTGGWQQDNKTAEAQRFFDDGLKNSDIVFYVGHARDGGGPDFSPPVLNAKTHHPDYPWYHKHQPGVNAMEKDLEGAPHSPKVLGIFACYAQSHFLDWLRGLAPKTGLILSGQQEFEASIAQATASLDSILGLRCEEQFNRAVDVITNVNHTVITPVKLDRVFK